MTVRRLPSGGSTSDPVAYAEEWCALAAPFENALGWRLTSFDPDVCMEAEGSFLRLSVEQAKRLGEEIRKEKP